MLPLKVALSNLVSNWKIALRNPLSPRKVDPVDGGAVGAHHLLLVPVVMTSAWWTLSAARSCRRGRRGSPFQVEGLRPGGDPLTAHFPRQISVAIPLRLRPESSGIGREYFLRKG
jgi:hypothetical protein